MTEVRVKARVYEVTIWPEEMEGLPDAVSFCIQVEYRGNDRWVLTRGLGHGGALYLTDDHHVNSFSTRPQYYDLATALFKAREWAPGMELMGWTAEHCLNWHLAGCPPEWR